MSKIRQRYDDEFRKNAVKLSYAQLRHYKAHVGVLRRSRYSPQHDLSLAENLYRKW